MTTDDPALNRLRWRCRRGLRELDLLLSGFLQQHFQRLDAHTQRAFETLLAKEDQQILDWLMGREQPREPALADIIQRLRQGETPWKP